jgi:hypothetical protein
VSALVWDQTGERLYETGVRKGVFYGDDRVGVPWNGLTSVEENLDTEAKPVYFDGVKINDLVTVGDYSATLKAFTYPDEFLVYEGSEDASEGFLITAQEPRRFGLSYQTLVGNDLGAEHYKIHLVYNALAVPTSKSFETISEDVAPTDFEWAITCVPEELTNFRPTAHVIFDSRRIPATLLADIETILYGDETHEPMLPPLRNFAAFIRNWHRLVIIDYGDGTWRADDSMEEGFITMINETTFQIVTDTATYLDADTYTISSTDTNEDDL